MSTPGAAGSIRAVISDFGGVLTSPLLDAFSSIQDSSGISVEELGMATFALAGRLGVNPLIELETGRMSEPDFLEALGTQLSEQLGRTVHMHGFGEAYFESLNANQPMIDYMRELRGRGYRMAICTNNVREWEQRWRSMLPVDEIFDVVVDSAFVGSRKPEPEIYRLTLDRLDLPAEACLFVDDIDVNCDGARQAGMRTVHFRETGQAIREIEAALNGA
ncbi:MAG TPA: HAD family phosphatase [Solirubrobacteraceae bacterium]|jgi:putative hydrolase of the HAD superfamily|nr:HAD family phosphatase [Solirubrobacteraceae bacterium]